MILGRVLVKNLQQKLTAAFQSSSFCICRSGTTKLTRKTPNNILRRGFAGVQVSSDEKSTTISEGLADKVRSAEKSAQARELEVSDTGQFKLRRKPVLRNPNLEFIPGDILAVLPSGMGDALSQSPKLLDRLYDDLGLKPSQLAGRVIQNGECYKLLYEMPGFRKNEVKIKLRDDRILTISGEFKEKDAQHGKSQCHASVSLPADAKVDEIRAELRDGVLDISIPRADQIPEKGVKSIH